MIKDKTISVKRSKHTLIKTLEGYNYYGLAVVNISDLRSVMLEGVKDEK